jgi:hypothetical protein
MMALNEIAGLNDGLRPQGTGLVLLLVGVWVRGE